nr:immunoglobulin heavy chain junction region [Mus musculus]MBK4197490.1 immunoglobulin heavy chain junction region [Mus musculus]
CASLARGFAYW